MLKQSCLKHQRIRTSNQPKFYLDQRAVSVSTQPESLGKEWGGGGYYLPVSTEDRGGTGSMK